MNGKDVLLDLLEKFTYWIDWTIKDLTLEELTWQPDPEANNIGQTMWHICRSFDVIKVSGFENQSVDEELWFKDGWAAKTSYDPPRGPFGLGNLGGYTQKEVDEVPLLPVEDVLDYFNQVMRKLINYLEQRPLEWLEEPITGWSDWDQSNYETLRNFLMDMLGHLGEIKAIIAMKKRLAVT